MRRLRRARGKKASFLVAALALFAGCRGSDSSVNAPAAGQSPRRASGLQATVPAAPTRPSFPMLEDGHEVWRNPDDIDRFPYATLDYETRSRYSDRERCRDIGGRLPSTVDWANLAAAQGAQILAPNDFHGQEGFVPIKLNRYDAAPALYYNASGYRRAPALGAPNQRLFGVRSRRDSPAFDAETGQFVDNPADILISSSYRTSPALPIRCIVREVEERPAPKVQGLFCSDGSENQYGSFASNDDRLNPTDGRGVSELVRVWSVPPRNSPTGQSPGYLRVRFFSRATRQISPWQIRMAQLEGAALRETETNPLGQAGFFTRGTAMILTKDTASRNIERTPGWNSVVPTAGRATYCVFTENIDRLRQESHARCDVLREPGIIDAFATYAVILNQKVLLQGAQWPDANAKLVELMADGCLPSELADALARRR